MVKPCAGLMLRFMKNPQNLNLLVNNAIGQGIRQTRYMPLQDFIVIGLMADMRLLGQQQ